MKSYGLDIDLSSAGGGCYLWPERPAILICQDVRQDAGLVSEGCLIQELERLRCLKCSHIFFFLFFFLLFSCVFFSFFLVVGIQNFREHALLIRGLGTSFWRLTRSWGYNFSWGLNKLISQMGCILNFRGSEATRCRVSPFYNVDACEFCPVVS